MPETKRFETVRILYDGECPFCAAYVKMARLKSLSGHVELLDARQHPALVTEHASEGRDIDQGMVV
ncbi:MAG: DCC1-like thiol-disulfide oxidoreductase family protein, partial [Pseudomonadota bacterium]